MLRVNIKEFELGQSAQHLKKNPAQISKVWVPWGINKYEWINIRQGIATATITKNEMENEEMFGEKKKYIMYIDIKVEWKSASC